MRHWRAVVTAVEVKLGWVAVAREQPSRAGKLKRRQQLWYEWQQQRQERSSRAEKTWESGTLLASSSSAAPARSLFVESVVWHKSQSLADPCIYRYGVARLIIESGTS